MSSISPYSPSLTPSYGISPASGYDKLDKAYGLEEEKEQECETCKSRKYQDGSDEMVSFKAPSHIDPQFAGTAVRAHEQEHVSNAYSKAATNNGEVLSASVSIQMGTCPECGTAYVSGGTTKTQIKYSDEENPYQQDKMAADYLNFSGKNAEYSV